jgi:hypothetical protein
MGKKPIKILSKNRFNIIFSFIALILLCDTIFGLKIIVKMETAVWYESTLGIIFVFLFTVLMVGFFNSSISRVYFYNDYIYMKTLFKKRKIYYKDIAELAFNSSSSPQDSYFVFYDAGENILGTLPLQYLGKREKQKDFIHFIMNQHASVKLDRNCERLLDSIA